MSKKILLNQEKNFKADFGFVYRSSATFYVPKKIKTTISIFNYWKFKNKKDVAILITEREMDGKLVRRREKNFSANSVLNISDFSIKEGSVEVEAFSNSNIKIPYAAAMIVYDSINSISMVHSYSRNHSLVELESNDAITKGRESCWTIRPQFNNSALFHNGHLEVNEQKAKLILTNSKNKDKVLFFIIPKLKPYQTFRFDLEKIYPKFNKHLINKEGFGTLHFKNNSSFTRLLIVWSDKSNKNFQATHSNFDYSNYVTNKLKSHKGVEMPFARFKNNLQSSQLIIYPKFEKNIFTLKLDNEIFDKKINSGKILNISKNTSRATFSFMNNIVPSRLVTALSGKSKNQKIPFECSLGVIHEKTQIKRFSWSLISAQYKTYIHLNFNNILKPEKKFQLFFTVYNSKNSDTLNKSIYIDKKDFSSPLIFELEELFPKHKNFLKKEYGYLTLFTKNSALRMLTSFYSSKKGITLEHSF
tara:strand:- start:21724 stop:23145 length:1422 start_codon:yes stop_codon:yes gene_type:complete